MHSMLVAQGRRDIEISKCNKSTTNFREKKKELSGIEMMMMMMMMWN